MSSDLTMTTTVAAQLEGRQAVDDGALADTLADALLRAAGEAPDRGVVLVAPDGLSSTVLTYPELLEAARSVLAGLLRAGCGPGDTIVLYGLDLTDYFPALWACLLGGLVPLPVDARRDTASRTRSAERLRGVHDVLGRPRILTDAAGIGTLAGQDDVRPIDIAECRAAAVTDLTPPPAPDGADTALLMLSSGSTGKPKLIPLTHAGLVDFAAGNRHMLRWEQQEKTLNWLPLDLSASLLLYHVLPVFLRMTNVHAPPEVVLARPARWFDLVSEHGAHHTWAPTFAFRLLCSALAGGDERRRWDLTHVRTIVSGGEQITVRAIDDLLDALAPYGLRRDCFVPAWGMTETCTGITFGRYGEPGSVHRLRSSSLSGRVVPAGPEVPDEECTSYVALGRPAPGSAVRIVDDRRQVLTEGEIGHLQVRSPRVTPGYLHDDEANARAFPEGPRGPESWLATGDLAYVMDGTLVMIGRHKDVIVINGENHSCTAIEAVVETVDGVTQGAVAACGIPDEALGSERLAIFFACSPGDRTAGEIAGDVGRTVVRRLGLFAHHLVPLAPEDFPRTPGGKLRRADLAAMVPGRRDPEGPPPPATVSPSLLRLLRREVASLGVRVDPQAGDDHRPFYEFGLTSVSMVRLHARLNEVLGRDLPVHVLFEHASIADLATFLDQGAGEPGRGTGPRSAPDPRVAVIGIGLRLPGARTAAEYWENLRQGKDCTTASPGLTRRGVLDHVFAFDPRFFGMSPKEATLTHPAHRLFLECAYEALEGAGYGADHVGARVGVFAGEGMTLLGYQSPASGGRPADGLTDAMQAAIGRQSDFLASTVSFRLGLTGPAIGVQTACSTSLTAVHLAVQALRAGDADMALAGAAAIHLPQDSRYVHHPGSVLSPTGMCRPFDAAADGTVPGNGVGVILLKPLGAAIEDGDPVLAVISGTAVNNDGRRKAGFTAPSVQGQVDVVRTALRRAGLRGDDLGYVEAHGTGTPVGDPIEFEALSRALRSDSGRVGFCAVGSVKSSIGHLDTCSGIAGLIKVMLMLAHRELVPTLNLSKPHPALNLESGPLVLAASPRAAPWPPAGSRPLRAGVNSLGVGGTNAFVIVEEPPARVLPPPDERSSPVPLSGRTETAPPRDGSTAFVFSGQGNARYGMARDLHASLPVFRGVIDACERAHLEHTGVSLSDALLGRPESGPLPNDLAQPAAFAFQVALAAQLRDWGVEPEYVCGHSLGEISALCVGGALSVREGVLLTADRGRLTESAVAEGGMLAVRGDAGRVGRLARDSGLEIAARNGAREFVLSGTVTAVRRCEGLLTEAELDWRRLPVNRAFHSALLDPMLDEWERAVSARTLSPLRVPLISSVDGAVLPAGAAPDPRYLVRHARHVVRYDLAMSSLRDSGCRVFVEIGPGDELTALGRRLMPDLDWSPAQRRGTEPLRALALAMGELHTVGRPVAWSRIAEEGRRVTLPGQAFQRTDIPYTGHEEKVAVNGPLTIIRSLTAERLGLAPADVDVDATFVALGGDSLSLVSLTRQVAGEFGVRVPLRALFDEADTPRKLAEAVTGGGEVDTPPPPTPESGPEVATTDLADVCAAQLRLAESMVDKVTGLIARQLDVLASRPAPQPPAQVVSPPPSVTAPRTTAPLTTAPLTTAPARSHPDRAVTGACDFSLYFFGNYPDQEADARYAHIVAAAEFADRQDFHALWIPERHFHSFGGLFPNPSVLAAALATRTSRVRLHAGSVVLPLHDPIRVAEEWSMVDNLSQGRAGLCVASGWHANDFALAPGSYDDRRNLMIERLGTVRRLWAGEKIPVTSGTGETIEVGLFPRPVQPRPPLYVAVVGSPDSYRRAAENDLGIVTNLMSQSIGQLAANIALYRRARAEHGLDPAAGRVVVLVHTYMGDDLDRVRQEAYGPFREYLRASLHLLGDLAGSLGIEGDVTRADQQDLEYLLDEAYERYRLERALIGTPESCRPIADSLIAAGVDEIACFVDFGLPGERMLAGLPKLSALRDEVAAPPARPQADQPVRPPAPASPAQRRLWIVEQMYPGRHDYWEPKGILLEGALDVEALLGALHRVIARHPQLRSRFRESEGRILQFFHAPGPVRCPVVDLTGRTVEEAHAELARELRGRTRDLSEGPLVLATLAVLGADRHMLFLLAHHIVFDSFSTGVFARDLAAFYRAWPDPPADLPALPAAVEARPGHTPGDIAFWTGELAGVQVLTLPTDHAVAGSHAVRGASLTREFGDQLAAGIETYARDHGATTFMVILSALGAVLARMAGQDDFMLGTAVTDRPEGTEHQVGMFINTLVLRMDVTGDPSFAQLVRRVRERSTRAYERQNVPFDDLVTALNPERVAGANPLFDVMIEYENAAGLDFDPPRVRAELVDAPADRAPFALTFYLTRHDAGLRCAVEYDSALFDESTVVRILDYTGEVLARALTDGTAPLSALTRLTAADRDALDALGARQAPANVPEPPLCLHHLVEEQARRTPDATAIVGDEGRLTYRELDEAANALGGALAGRNLGRGDRIAVCMAPGANLIITLLAVLKTGAAYVPLDISLPESRIDFCLDDSNAALLVVDEGFGRSPRERTYVVDDTARMSFATEPPRVRSTPEDIAYCVYTSGSSGRPKAVQVPHRGPVNLMRWQLRNHPPLRTLQWTSPGFDVSVQEIFGTLASGAALVVVPEGVRRDAEALGAAMNRHGVQRLHLPYTALKYLAECGLRVPSLREVLSAGEPLRISTALRRFLDAHPGVRLYNQYGPTETSVIVTSHEVTDVGNPRVPIGRPIDDVRLHVMDGDRQEVPIGAIGELYVGGAAVAHGYLNDPVLTEKCFLPGAEGPIYRTGDLVRWRADGDLEFHGRRDQQVKIRGHRVEPGETEWALGRLAGVRNCAVLVRSDASGDPQLVAYVVIEPGTFSEERPWHVELRDTLRALLPSYLVPDKWIRVDELPMNANRKLLTAGLPDPVEEDEAADRAKPVTPAEEALHGIWCAELELRAMPVTRSFFDAGGNSLKALRVITLMRERFGYQYPLADFMAEPDIRSVASRLELANAVHTVH
ncbi:amino acid adenylation domain-containing protein [Nonomuraea sp. 3-1Str]|uniref:non-ribosomal peptide synthetase/type I polyketide synthase n=1 Tax=Nonomuraea sp. 3-1Str TaxID=2929801 RepID=UPI00285952B3|nr:non-ribosomal peptide synthetase/type I polyketide synthase [Nonomuraea sp. 3-1Str]MDR8414087.1 amino acid adenylation domain-containing protein [Nonomuraea sp. 3-1Str]